MDIAALTLTVGVPVAAGAWAEVRYAQGKKRAERAWRETNVKKLRGVGTTSSLAILPLVDWFVARPGLMGEAGVSYLIKTDENTILMDVGLNFAKAHPSPLLHNMHELGVSRSEIDTIVISHLHADHVGGIPWLARRTFSLGNEQIPLAGKRIFAPVPLSYPGVTPRCSSGPTIVAHGVATIGAIDAQIYMGPIAEQALAIRIEGKGVLLVVGCGHQTLPKILQRTTELFDEPIYGIVGGLHYPYPHGRWRPLGVDLQQLLVYGPFRGPNREDVLREMRSLAERRPSWVSLSAHDSSDEIIEEFRRTFGESYRSLRVGEWQRISEARRAERVVAIAG